MAGRGPAPKEDPIRTNKPTIAATTTEWDGVTRGHDLPFIFVDDGYGGVTAFGWHPMTVQWWESWRVSPQALVMHESDWQSMFETAVLHTKYYNGLTTLKPTELTNLASELRRRMAAYGATYEDRLRLRMTIKTDQDAITEEKAIQADAASAVDYATRLAQAAAKLKD